MAKVKIYVSLKEGILDPQGKTIQHSLSNLGYSNMENVKIGKYITLDIQGKDIEKQIEDACNKLLTNPVIEEFTYEVSE